MQDGRSRITVVGARRRVDVAVPSAAPIGEYADGLADLCGLAGRGVSPPAWSLAPVAGPALPLGASIGEAGVADGQVLYLQDITRDPGAAPAVDDIDELVIGEAQRLRDRGGPRGIGVILIGLVWLAVTAAYFFLTGGDEVIPAAVSLTVAGLLLLSTAWALEQRQARVPSALCLGMSLSSIPCFAASGAILATGLTGPATVWLGAVIGANAGALLTLVATPEPVVFAIELPCAIAAAVAGTLVSVHASAAQAAAAVVVVALGLIALARPTAAAITVFHRRVRSGGRDAAHITTDLLIQARQLVAVVIAAPVLAAAVCLVILASSEDPFSISLAGVVALGLAIRARQSVVRLETAQLGGAAAVGLFAVLIAVTEYLPGDVWVPVILVGVGLILVMVGITSTLTAEPAPTGAGPAEWGPPPRRGIDSTGPILSMLIAPLAMGAFGVLDQLVVIGRGILH
jgi:type VII secretion integral membrane protein EccD